MRKVLAECLKTHPDENDIREYCDGYIETHEIRIYHKGQCYYVIEGYYNTEYYEIIEPRIYEEK